MSTVGRLDVQLGLDSSKLDKGLKEENSRLKKWGDNLKGIGTKMTAGLTLPILGGFSKMVMGASDLAEATSAVQATFGDTADTIIKASKDSASAVGMSSEQFLTANKIMGVYAQSAGLTGDAMTKFSLETVAAAADLASFHNVPMDEALAAIQSGLSGETEPLKKFGILINEAALNEYAWANGIAATGAALTEEQKVLSRQGLILGGLGPATGDFARTSEGLANQMRIAKAEMANVSAELGTVLLPYVLKGVKHLRKLMERFKGLNKQQKKWVVILLAVAAGIGPVVIGIGMLTTALAVLTGPIGLIVLALIGLGIAYRSNFLGFGDAVNWVSGKLLKGVKGVMKFSKALIAVFRSGKSVKEQLTAFPKPLQPIMRGFLLIADAIGDLVAAWKSGGFGHMMDVLPQKFAQIKQGLAQLGDALKGAFKIAVGIAIDYIKSIDWGSVLKTAARLIWQGFLLALKLEWALIKLYFKGIKKVILDYLPAVISWLAPKGKELIKGLLQGAKDKWPVVKEWLKGMPDVVKGYLASALKKLVSRGKEFIAGLYEGIVAKWPTVRDWIKAMPGKIFDFLVSAATKLVSRGRGFIGGLYEGVTAKWPVVREFIRSIPGRLFDFLESAGTKLYSRGKAFIAGLYEGIKDKWPTVREWIRALPGKVYDFLSSAGTKLLGRGKEFLTGLRDGLVSKFGFAGSGTDTITGFITAIPGWILNHISNAIEAIKGSLKTAGENLLGYVASGLQWVWDNTIGPIIQKIKDGIGWINDHTPGLPGLPDIPNIPGPWTDSIQSFTGSGSSMAMASSGGNRFGDVHIHIDGYNQDPTTLANKVAAVLNRELDLYSGAVN